LLRRRRQRGWTGTHGQARGGDTEYTNAANWTLGVVPDVVDGSNHYGMAVWTDVSIPVLTSTAEVQVVDIMYPGGGAEFTIASGGHLTTIEWAVLSWNPGETGTLNVETGATFSVGTELFVSWDGTGILNVNGGTINVAGGFAYDTGTPGLGWGETYINSGTINAAWLGTTDFGFIDITGSGQLNLAGDVADVILTNQVAWGHIIAEGGTKAVDVSYNPSLDRTEIKVSILPPLVTPTVWIDAENLYWSSTTNGASYSVDYKTDLVAGSWLELTNGIASTPFTNSIPLPLDLYDPAFFQVNTYHP